MKSSLLRPLVLLSFSSIFVYGSKYYIPFSFGLTWDGAQHFCKRYYTGLATISTWSDADSMDLKQYLVWSGLSKDWSYWWRWSDGQYYDYPNWARNEPKEGSCAAVYFSNKKLYASTCDAQRMFFCQKGNSYIFVKEAKTWSEALKYCRDNHGDLAGFRSSDMNNIFTELDFPVWVGMRNEGGSFKWISGNSGYTNWSTAEPSIMGQCATISSLTKLMATSNCDLPHPFVCIQEGNINVFLVKESKSWEEALEHCRGLNGSGLRFDLVSVQPGNQQEDIMSKAMEANTKEVWTGLRFLSDDWLWVNGADLLNTDLNQCPMQKQHCGALSKNNTGSMEARDCSERKNFLCYSFPL